MTEDIIHAQYDITKKSKLRKFYEKNKILIFSIILILIISSVSLTLYLKIKERNKILLSENYVKAKIHLENGEKKQALSLLKEIIFADDSTYSTLGFFLIINQDLIQDYKELLLLFDRVLENNKFEKEVKNLLIYKKALYSADFITESELLEDMKPLLKDETLWKSHALLLLGDYFTYKNEYFKAKEFYEEVLSIKNLQRDLYDQAIFQLSQISSN